MPVPIGLDSPCSFAIPIRASLTVPDMTLVTAVHFTALFPDGTTEATWSGVIPVTVPARVRGYESIAGNANPIPDLLIALHVFAPTDDPQIGTYLVRPILTVTGAANPVPAPARQLQVTGKYGQ